MSEDLPAQDHAEVVAAIAQLRDAGCPVGSRPEEMAAIAIRRWRSAKNRGLKASDMEPRVRDLTKGLISHFERDPHLVGPLRADYEHVARTIADILVKIDGE